MYLSKAYLNTQNSQVIQDLGNIYDFHRRISILFPNTTNNKSFRKEFQILYRIDNPKDERTPYLLIQSKIAPEWSNLLDSYPYYFKGTPESKDLIPFLNKLLEMQNHIFKLKVNPVKRPPPKKYGKGEYRGKTNRIPIQREEKLIKWLERKSKTSGFRLLQIHTTNEENIFDIRVRNVPKARIKTPYRYQNVISKKREHNLTFHSVIFEGRLQIVNIKQFKEALISGIGPGKAFGFGMLSIYPLRK